MNVQKVVMVGFCSKGYFTLEPLICKLYGVTKCEQVATVEELTKYEGFIDSIFISLTYLGLDFNLKLKKIRKMLPAVQIVCYAAHHVNVQIGVHLIRSGVDTLYANVNTAAEYEKAADGIQNKHRYYPKNIRDAMASDEHHEPCGFLLLTVREREWLNLLLKGYSIKKIKEIMQISHGTVSSMRKTTLLKMGVETTHQLLFRAFIYNFGRGSDDEDDV